MKDESVIPEQPALMDRRDILQMRLADLRRQHRLLDERIAAIPRAAAADALALRRMKKEKLALKDQIVRIEDQLTPDIIA